MCSLGHVRAGFMQVEAGGVRCCRVCAELEVGDRGSPATAVICCLGSKCCARGMGLLAGRMRLRVRLAGLCTQDE